MVVVQGAGKALPMQLGRKGLLRAQQTDAQRATTGPANNAMRAKQMPASLHATNTTVHSPAHEYCSQRPASMLLA